MELMEIKVNNNFYLLDFNKSSSELKFMGEINSIEFVELIDDMDLSYSTNYVKRDLYLKNLGKELFRIFKEKIYRKSKIQIVINRDIKYISKKASKNWVKLFFLKICKLNVIISISVIKFKNCNEYIDNNYSAKTIEALSQDEIDSLLTAININDAK